MDRDVNIDTDIYQGYRFEYNEATNETIVSAVFKAGSKDGEVIRLSSPAVFTVNDEFCNFQDSAEYPYMLSYASRLPEAVLDLVDFRRQEYINRIELDSLIPVKDFHAVIDSASHELKVSFSGNKLCKGEELRLLVSAGDEEVSYIVSGLTDNVLLIGKEILNDFAGRTVRMRLCRIRNAELNNASPAGGSVRFVYSSKIKEVVIP